MKACTLEQVSGQDALPQPCGGSFEMARTPLPSQAQPSEWHQASRERAYSSSAPRTTPLTALPLGAKEREKHFASHRIGNTARKPLGVPDASPQQRSARATHAPHAHPPTCVEPSSRFSSSCPSFLTMLAPLWGCGCSTYQMTRCSFLGLYCCWSSAQHDMAWWGQDEIQRCLFVWLEVCKAWTVQPVQKWDQQRALWYCRSPTRPRPWSGNGVIPKPCRAASRM